MRNIFLTMALSTLIVLSGSPVFADDSSDGYVLVNDDVWFVYLGEVHDNLDDAKTNFLKRDYNEAQKDTELAANKLKMEASRSSKAGKALLNKAADELDTMGKKIKNGSVDSVQELDTTSSNTYHALASHHLLLASKEWTKKQTSKAGHDLNAAATHVENAFKIAGKKIDSATASTLHAAKAMGHKMISGHKPKPEEVNVVFDNLLVVVNPAANNN